MGSGYWIAECVERAACQMVHGSVGGHAPTLQGPAALSDADVIIMAPCGFSIERTRSELAMATMLDAPEWRALAAVQHGRVFVADGNRYFNRSSCCVAETSEMVAEMVWPELTGLWGHHGKAWVRLEELDKFCHREGAPPPTKRVEIAEELAASQGASAKKAKHNGPTATSMTSHVECQVELLRAGDFVGAFDLNSAANRERIGGADKFEALVRGNSMFGALAARANPCKCAELNGKSVEVKVATPQDGSITFVFAVSKTEGDMYVTEGVGIGSC